MYFKQLELGPMQNFVYLLGDTETREAIVVDPGWEAGRILRQLDQDGYKLSAALITHAHPDHFMSLPEILEAVDVPVRIHSGEAEFLPIERGSVRAFADGDELRVGRHRITCVHTPGHTPGSTCFEAGGHLLTGDTLFIKGCGRTDLPGGDTEALYHSLMRLHGLDDACIVYPGHNYAPEPSISLGEEKRTSPLLQQRGVEEFLRLLGK